MNTLFTIEDDIFSLIPIEFNFILDQTDYTFGGFVFRKNMLQRLIAYSNSCKLYCVWDFKNVELCDDRMFDVLSEEMLTNVIIININKTPRVSEQLINSLEKMRKQYDIEDDTKEITFSAKAKQVLSALNAEGLYRNCISQMVQKNTRKYDRQWNYLVSSGVYSNMLIDLKGMFYKHIDTMYIIYSLYNRISEWGENFDYFAATSKNGVALATVLCELFQKDLICFNIGQMFEEIYNRKSIVEEGKRYVHIFDVICLGSEAKVVNALISAQGGILEKSFGVVCLQNLEVIREKNRYSFLNNVEPLITYDEVNLDYRISLTGKE